LPVLTAAEAARSWEPDDELSEAGGHWFLREGPAVAGAASTHSHAPG
jgi:hypothetical protein